MTDESSVISGANITDHHIAMVRDDVIIQTQIYTCSVMPHQYRSFIAKSVYRIVSNCVDASMFILQFFQSLCSL